MASISEDRNGYKRILFSLNDQRKAIRIGDVDRKRAAEVLLRVERLIEAKA